MRRAPQRRVSTHLSTGLGAGSTVPKSRRRDAAAVSAAYKLWGMSQPLWECEECGEHHVGACLNLAMRAPETWLKARPEERAAGHLHQALCELPVDGRMRHFVVAEIILPILDGPEREFVWRVWCEVDEPTLRALLRHTERDGPARLGRRAGTLDSNVGSESETPGETVWLRARGCWLFPEVEFPLVSQHPLAVARRVGVTWEEVLEFNQPYPGQGA